MTDHPVVIVGAGPTGLMLAGELALAGVRAVVVERRADQDLDGSRASGLHARTIEVLDQRGIAERFVAAGQTHPMVMWSMIPLDISDFPTRHNYVLALWQRHTERLLAEWVDELGVPVARNTEVVDLDQDTDGVDVVLSDGTTIRTCYLVGCDGARSVVRKQAGIDFPGWDPTTAWLIAEVETVDEPTFGMHPLGGGIGPADEGRVRIVLAGQDPARTGRPGLGELREALTAAYGTDWGAHSPAWISRFTDATRQASSYRSGRVLLGGDAAHVHPPQGGQGLNLGVQDAVNLGWKLARVVDGTSPETLLDTYHDERHPVAARVLRTTMAQVALGTPDERHRALHETMAGLLGMDEPRRRTVGLVSALDLRYDLGGGHPLVGRRMPDLDLQTREGPVRLFTLLHDARPLLLNLGPPDGAGTTAGAGSVHTVDADCAGPWELPVIGEVTAPLAVLIRPDGYVAWAGDPADPGLPRALALWFPPAAAHDGGVADGPPR